MSRTAVNWFLAVYLCVVWTAAMAQFDQFPLTWVKMYATYEPAELLSIRVADKADMHHGFRATARDGSTRWLTQRDLNLAKSHFRRLYRQKVFFEDPVGPWPYRLLRSVNRTLGYAPEAPQFIVRLEARIEKVSMRKTDLAIVERDSRPVNIEWTDEYQRRWYDEGP